MFGRGGRSDAQSALLVLTDGKASFQFQTAQKAKALKEKSVQIFVAPVSNSRGAELQFLREKVASHPWETNYVRIPGLLDLEMNPTLFVGKLIAMFCSDSISPSTQATADEARQFMFIHENGFP